MKSVIGYLHDIEDSELRLGCIKIFEHLDSKYEWYFKPAAKTHHHAYSGGLEIHTSEVIDYALRIHSLIPESKRFNLDWIIVSAFLHDCEKCFTYKLCEVTPSTPNGIDYVSIPCSHESLVFNLCSKVGLELPLEIVGAIEAAHGGFSSQVRGDPKYQMNTLACIIHSADLMSSRFGQISKL